MDAHVALELAHGRAGVDGVDERLHYFAAARAAERAAAEPPGLAVGRLLDVDLEEALGLAFLDRARHAGHRPLSDPRLDALLLDFFLREPDPAERRIRIERVDRNAIGPFAPGVAEEIVGD